MTTRAALSEDAIRAYVDKGYLVVPGLVATHDERNVVAIGEDPYAWKGYVDPPKRVFLRPHSRDDALAPGFGSFATTRKE